MPPADPLDQSAARLKDAAPIGFLVEAVLHLNKGIERDVQRLRRSHEERNGPAPGNRLLHLGERSLSFGRKVWLDVIGEASLAPDIVGNGLQHAVRIPDPFFQVHDRWLIRQLAPDIAKIDMPKPQDKRLALAPDLLRLMGRETANIHIGSRTTKDLVGRLDALDQDLRGWFPAATDRMVDSVRQDQAKWAARYGA